MRTVVCHFYNEEYMLPWWLQHHRWVFDHGIMIDYHSTDRSVEIIRNLCPSWEIRTTKNQYFDSTDVDNEVMDIERGLDGWRMALNVTEFLYGNLDHLPSDSGFAQYFIGNYVFVDLKDMAKTGELPILVSDRPLHDQRVWGYDEFQNKGTSRGGNMARMHRSIHNYPVEYTPGRHWGNGRPRSFNDLVIFYYGWADSSEPGIKRKMQIQDKMSAADKEMNAGNHVGTYEEYLTRFENQKRFARDLRSEIIPILDHHIRCTGQHW